ncbi:MAG: hypothetical protein ACRDZ3_19420, partial [Acidimicrobiia bacterium]
TGAVSGLVHKSLRAIGDIADRLSDVLVVVAIALAVATAVAALVLTGGTFAPIAVALWSFTTVTFQASAVAKAVSMGSKATSKAVFNDSDLNWGSLGKDGALALVGVFGAGKLLKGGQGLLRSAKGVLPATRGAAGAVKGLGAVAKSPGRIQRFAVYARRVGTDGLAKAKPLFLKGKEKWTKLMGTSEEPTVPGILSKTLASRGMWKEYSEDPLRIVRPVELGEQDSGSAVVVPLKKAA